MLFHREQRPAEGEPDRLGKEARRVLLVRAEPHGQAAPSPRRTCSAGPRFVPRTVSTSVPDGSGRGAGAKLERGRQKHIKGDAVHEPTGRRESPLRAPLSATVTDNQAGADAGRGEARDARFLAVMLQFWAARR